MIAFMMSQSLKSTHRLRHLRSNLQPSQQGMALVEFALILPLLLMIIFGTVEFGLALHDKNVITHAARVGARAGIVFQRDRTLSSMQTRAVNAAHFYCEGNLISLGAGNQNCEVTFTSTSAPVADDMLTVQVDYLYQGLLLGSLLNLSGNQIQLSARATMYVE
jgi:Flp pilus assembly protein TadG